MNNQRGLLQLFFSYCCPNNPCAFGHPIDPIVFFHKNNFQISLSPHTLQKNIVSKRVSDSVIVFNKIEKEGVFGV